MNKDLKMNSTGQRIRRLRKELGLTQKELGRAAGVSAPTVTLWEKDETLPRGDNQQNLLRALGTTWDYLREGKVSDQSSSEAIAELKATYKVQAIPLFDRANLSRYLKKEPAKEIKSLSSISVPEQMRSPAVFAMMEDKAGMSPFINKDDYVFIKPELPLADDYFSMFWMNETPIIGKIGITHTGMFLKFITKEPGWETIQVTKEDYIGRVIAIDPLWAREQRDK